MEIIKHGDHVCIYLYRYICMWINYIFFKFLFRGKLTEPMRDIFGDVITHFLVIDRTKEKNYKENRKQNLNNLINHLNLIRAVSEYTFYFLVHLDCAPR